MTARLSVRPLLFGDEPAYGFLARWATQLGYRTPASLAVDLSLDLGKVMRGKANVDLSKAASLPPDAFDGSTATIDNGRVRLAGMDVWAARWRAHSRRFCLRCLASDREVASRPGYGHVRVRTWWDFDFVRGCPIHGVPLTLSRRFSHHLASAERSADETDWGGPLEAVAEALPTTDAAFESYLVGRLGFAPAVDFPFLDRFEVSEVMSLLFSLAGMPGPDAAARAFGAVREGPAAVDRILTAQRRGNRIAQPRQGYKNSIYEWLEARLEDPRVEPLIEVVRRNARSHGLAQRFPVYLGEVQEQVRPAKAQCVSIAEVCESERLPSRDATILLRALGVIADSVAVGEKCVPLGPADGLLRKVLRHLLTSDGGAPWVPSDLVELRDAILLAPGRSPREAPSVGPCDVDIEVLSAVGAMRGLPPEPLPGRITIPLRRVPPRLRSDMIRGILEGKVKPVRMGPRREGNVLDLCVGFDGLP